MPFCCLQRRLSLLNVNFLVIIKNGFGYFLHLPFYQPRKLSFRCSLGFRADTQPTIRFSAAQTSAQVVVNFNTRETVPLPSYGEITFNKLTKKVL